MAASIRMRNVLLKNLYLPRTCILCRQCQNSTTSSTAVKSAGNPPSAVNGTNIPRGQIKIPKKKKRDSLSILKALASTVGKDPTGTSYQFMDDPYLIPTDTMRKKLYLLSKASGKRAARFMMDEFRNTFDHDAAIPHVKAFQPDIKDYQHTDVGSEALKERISRREVKDAIEIYQAMSEEGIELNPELQMSFLELLCVFSCKDPAPALMLEERVIDDIEFQNQPNNKISMSLADDVFQSLPDKTAEAYNCIARGLLKAGNSKGLLYYKEMKDSNIPVSSGTYNDLIRFGGTQKTQKWEQIEDNLREMKRNKVTPTLETFHSVLWAMRKTPENDFAVKVPAVLAEMKVLNIEPTLQTWSLVLSALYKKGVHSKESKKSDFVVLSDIIDIINYIRKDMDNIKTDHSTENFFVKAMDICGKCRDSDLAIMLYQLKEDMGSQYIITSLKDEDSFYDIFLKTISSTEEPEVLMKYYRKICPSQHKAKRFCMSSILDNLEMYRAYPDILQLWQESEFSLRSSTVNTQLLNQFLEVLSSDNVPEEIVQQILPDAKRLYNERLKNSELKMLDGLFFRNLIRMSLKTKKLDMAWEATMCFYKKERDGYLRESLHADVLKLCIAEQDVQKIMSFCDLPEHVRAMIVNHINEVLEDNRSILQECLDQSQLKQLEEAY